MTSTEQKCKSLQQRLNLISQEVPQQPQKQKISQLEQFMKKTYQKFTEDSIADEYRYKKIQDQYKGLETAIEQYTDHIVSKQKTNKSRMERWEKKMHKTLQKIQKERRDTEKSINSTLQNYLIELSSAKNKSDSCCKFALRDFQQLQQQLEALQTAIEGQSVANRQILQKINKQFSFQIEQINQMINSQKKANNNEQKKVFSRLQNMYKNLHSKIQKQKKYREERQQQAIQFLERVIEKVREQVSKQ